MASAARNVAARSIHIKIHPAARSLPEQREVLRVLERFGEVEMFKSLKYDPTNPVPNAFLSILSSEEAAQAALEASPIRYRLVADPTPSPLSPDAPASSPSYPQSAFTTQTNPPAASPPSLPMSESLFELRISASPHPHHAAIAASPLHGSYTPISPQRSPVALDLATRVPHSIAKAGLLDWVTDSVRGRRRRGGAGGSARAAELEDGDGDGGGGGGGDVSGDGKTTTVHWGSGGGKGGAEEMRKPWRLKDKERVTREDGVPWVMKGLKAGPPREDV